MDVERLVVDDPAGVCAEVLGSAVERGSQVVLTGGSTPRAAYERAAAAHADWRNAAIWFTDERCVPPTHEHSNYGMTKASLLDRLGSLGPEVHRMRGEEGPEQGARLYADELRSFDGRGLPRFDLILLGLGSDGHVASLFPGRPELHETERTVVPVSDPGLDPYVPRISLSMPVINAARSVVFLVTGEGKAEAVASALGGNPSIPASLVSPTDGTLTWILDAAAASRLADAA